MKVELAPRTWTYLIRYEFISGREYVSEARAYLSGMAGKVSLKDGHTDNDKVVTLLLDCYTCDYGVETIARSFGRSETAATHKLVLELKLMSGKVKWWSLMSLIKLAGNPREESLLSMALWSLLKKEKDPAAPDSTGM